MPTYHTNKSYDSDLRLLSDHILLIASRVQKMVANSVKALSTSNIELAKETIAFDKIIDKDEMAIDRQCLELLAQRQPLGQDLRFVVAVIKMVSYFERMGDLAVKICQRVIKLKSLENPVGTSGLVEMSKLVQDMIKEVIEAFLLQDNNRALKIIEQDDFIDEIYHQTTKIYIKEMGASNTECEMQAYFHMLSITKWLERIGDHCTNLAELIIFMVKGEDVRHQHIHSSERK